MIRVDFSLPTLVKIFKELELQLFWRGLHFELYMILEYYKKSYNHSLKRTFTLFILNYFDINKINFCTMNKNIFFYSWIGSLSRRWIRSQQQFLKPAGTLSVTRNPGQSLLCKAWKLAYLPWCPRIWSLGIGYGVSWPKIALPCSTIMQVGYLSVLPSCPNLLEILPYEPPWFTWKLIYPCPRHHLEAQMHVCTQKRGNTKKGEIHEAETRKLHLWRSFQSLHETSGWTHSLYCW